MICDLSRWKLPQSGHSESRFEDSQLGIHGKGHYIKPYVREAALVLSMRAQVTEKYLTVEVLALVAGDWSREAVQRNAETCRNSSRLYLRVKSNLVALFLQSFAAIGLVFESLCNCNILTTLPTSPGPITKQRLQYEAFLTRSYFLSGLHISVAQ
jgi:hypothetical protein